MENLKPLVVSLDLDEFLIYSSEHPLNHLEHDFRSDDYYTHIRPGAIEFVRKLINDPRFTPGIFTSANKTYSRHIPTQMGFQLDDFAFVLSSEQISKKPLDIYSPYFSSYDYQSIKNLIHVRRRTRTSLRRIIALDDKASFYQEQYSNAVIVPRWEGEEEDGSIFDKLWSFLEHLATLDNIRPLEKRGWLEKSWAA